MQVHLPGPKAYILYFHTSPARFCSSNYTGGGENRPEYTLPGVKIFGAVIGFNKLYFKCLLAIIITSLLQNKTQSNWVMAILCVNFLSLEI